MRINTYVMCVTHVRAYDVMCLPDPPIPSTELTFVLPTNAEATPMVVVVVVATTSSRR